MITTGIIVAGARAGPATALARSVPGHDQVKEQQGGQEDDQAGKEHQQDYDQQSLDVQRSPRLAPELNWWMAASSVGDAGCKQLSPDREFIGSLLPTMPVLPLYRTTCRSVVCNPHHPVAVDYVPFSR